MKERASVAVNLRTVNRDEVMTTSVWETENIRPRSRDCLLWLTMMTSLSLQTETETAVHRGVTNPRLHISQSQRRVLGPRDTTTGTEFYLGCGRLEILVLWSWSRFWSRFTSLVSAEVRQFIADLSVVHPVRVLHLKLTGVTGKWFFFVSVSRRYCSDLESSVFVSMPAVFVLRLLSRLRPTTALCILLSSEHSFCHNDTVLLSRTDCSET